MEEGASELQRPQSVDRAADPASLECSTAVSTHRGVVTNSAGGGGQDIFQEWTKLSWNLKNEQK